MSREHSREVGNCAINAAYLKTNEFESAAFERPEERWHSRRPTLRGLVTLNTCTKAQQQPTLHTVFFDEQAEAEQVFSPVRLERPARLNVDPQRLYLLYLGRDTYPRKAIRFAIRPSSSPFSS